jgi:predicted TIM-barrel fold metal-dependent hydrolase
MTQTIEAQPVEQRIIDVDSHVAEPEDLWTSRMSAAKWGEDRIPKPVWDEVGGEKRWKVGDLLLSGVGLYCSGGWPEHFPSHPPTLEDADPACWDPSARLQRLDDYGIWAQVLYPNLIAFDIDAFRKELGHDMAVACIEAYNDYLVDFASVDPRRFIPLAMVPFWDIEASIRELERARERGHKGVLFAALFERLGLANISDPVWEPFLAAAQDLEMSLNFHIGFGVRKKEKSQQGWDLLRQNQLDQNTDRLGFVRKGGPYFSSCAQAITDVIISGVAHKFPRLKFVSVESGFGYFPFLLENLDWLWQTSAAIHEFPERDMPSDYFRRQCYATMWFERSSVHNLPDFQDNVMFETDFPHETGLNPGPASPAKSARETAEANLSVLDPEVRHKILYANAAKLYHMD